LAKEQIAVDRAEDAGELGLAGDLALAARDVDRELELAPQLLGGPVEIDLHVLQDAELVGADPAAGDIGTVAPQRAGAECELHWVLLMSEVNNETVRTREKDNALARRARRMRQGREGAGAAKAPLRTLHHVRAGSPRIRCGFRVT
jgi:hypothetical protein